MQLLNNCSFNIIFFLFYELHNLVGLSLLLIMLIFYYTNLLL